MSGLDLSEFSPATRDAWREAAEESLKGGSLEKKLLTPLHEGITLRPIYGAEDGVAGKGIIPPRGTRAPLVAQEIPLGLPGDFNSAVLWDLMRGQDALCIQLDVASRRGLDPSEAETGEVAVCGLSLACVRDAEVAFAGVEPSAIDLLLWAGATALPMLGLFAAHCERWHGAILGDPLAEYVRDGCLPLALDDAFEEMAVCVRWSAAHGRRFRTVGVNAALWGEAGGSAVEELAYGLASAVEYLRELERRGIGVEESAAQVVFTMGVNAQVLLQIAKLRAFRRLWEMVQVAHGVRPIPAFVHVRSAMFNKSVLDPYTNMLRATAEGMAGVLGGADSLHVAAFDEVMRTPDGFSRRIARNVHPILSEECLLSACADPAAGSWFLECLTKELAGKAWEVFQGVEAEGGLVAALRDGSPQASVQGVAARRMEAVAKRRDGMIGVNLFPNVAERFPEQGVSDLRAMHGRRAAEIEGLRPHGMSRVERSVEAVAGAFASGATLGQVRELLPRSAAVEPPVARLPFRRAAADFEALRLAAWRFERQQGHLPVAWLATFGPRKQHAARAEFASGFLAAGGFEIQQGGGASSVGEAVAAAVKSSAPLVVMCSTDETYPQLVPAFVSGLRGQSTNVLIYLAGYPPDHVESFRAAGVDGFIHLRANCLQTLQQLHRALNL